MELKKVEKCPKVVGLLDLCACSQSDVTSMERRRVFDLSKYYSVIYYYLHTCSILFLSFVFLLFFLLSMCCKERSTAYWVDLTTTFNSSIVKFYFSTSSFYISILTSSVNKLNLYQLLEDFVYPLPMAKYFDVKLPNWLYTNYVKKMILTIISKNNLMRQWMTSF